MERILLNGLCNVPADSACARGTLALAIGCVPEYGALAPVRPVDVAPMLPQPTAWDPAPVPMPVIEFGLKRAGYVAMEQALQLPASMCGTVDSSIPGSGAWTVHASSATQTANQESAAKTVHNRLMQAIANQSTSRGLMHQPFMVRYAVRMTDGTYVAVSPPVAMLPSVLPPCFAIASSQSTGDDECLLTISSTSAHFCRLRCRVVEGLPANVAANVAAVDIFCTPQALTYREDVAVTDGVVSYAAMSMDAAGHRGSVTALDEIFVGHWAESGDAATDFYLDDMPWANARCWALQCDASWEARLLAADAYYRVASIPAASLVTSADFFDVPVCDASESALKKLPRLAAGAANIPAVVPDAVLWQGESVIVGGTAARTGDAWPLRSMMAYSNGAEAACVRLSVLAKGADGEYSVSAECSGSADTTRYLYADIPGAYAVAIASGNDCAMMRLTPHPSLPGAYWWGGTHRALSGVSNVSAGSLPEAGSSTECGLRIEARSLANPWHAQKVWNLPAGRVIAMAQSLRAMSSGQFGQFGQYAFTDAGLWVLPLTDSAPVMIATDTCVNARAVAAVEDGIAYVSRRGVHLVNGSKSQLISGELSGESALDIAELPGIDSILSIAGAPLPLSLRDCLADARLAYDKDRCRLIVAGSGSANYVYSMQSGKWGMCAAMRGDADASATGAAIVTRPMALDGALNRVRAVGRLDAEASATCVYGSNDLDTWHVVASAPAAATDIITGTAYRYYIVAAATHGCITALALNEE